MQTRARARLVSIERRHRRPLLRCVQQHPTSCEAGSGLMRVRQQKVVNRSDGRRTRTCCDWPGPPRVTQEAPARSRLDSDSAGAGPAPARAVSLAWDDDAGRGRRSNRAWPLERECGQASLRFDPEALDAEPRCTRPVGVEDAGRTGAAPFAEKLAPDGCGGRPAYEVRRDALPTKRYQGVNGAVLGA